MQAFVQKQNRPQERISPCLARSSPAACGRQDHREPTTLRDLPRGPVSFDFSRIKLFPTNLTKPQATRTGGTPVDFRAQFSSCPSDQKLAVSAFEESMNGIHIEATASGVEFPDPWETPDGFRWVQTVIT